MEKQFVDDRLRTIIKSVDDERREITGIAVSPAKDRSGNSIEPTSLTYIDSVPLVLHGNLEKPVGTVQLGKATARGIPFRASIAKITETSPLKQTTDEAWHSVKAGLIRCIDPVVVSREGVATTSGVRVVGGEICALSLVAISTNPDTRIATVKSLDQGGAFSTIYQLNEKDTTMNEAIRMHDNTLVRAAVAKAVAGGANASLYAASRWGSRSTAAAYMKALSNPMVAEADATGALTAGEISRSEFVQAVFSRSILGRMQGLIRVPAITRVNAETSPTAGAFYGEGTALPVAQGDVSVQLVDKRKAGIVAVLSQELLKATDDTAEAAVTGILVRALSRAIDNAFVGSQARGAVSPEGLAHSAAQATGFAAGVNAFTGDITQAYVLVNPLTAVTLRSPTETQITARGGYYGGLPAIASYGVPAGQIFIVDATRVLAYIGEVVVDAIERGMVFNGERASVPISMFQTGQVALAAQQYVDWELVPGAAVQVMLP
ncbi:phage major capsid protein [Burkholderia cenocepacia]|uniref:phage major capsid protein n=1 Tax=Burkholderia cenocepacia TaxID=95486 RepID=UPI0020121A40|nr:phage major capsid protein [Burkholderia cenocepacia]MDI9688475.1 phage major capsid protein [Burkholderia cenocepacia]